MPALDGVRVLVVEDEVLVAMLLEDILSLAGCVILGPIKRVEKALQASREEMIDIAVLDVNLGGERVYPVADALVQRNVPFVFMTGYGRGMLPEKYARHPTMAKPFRPPELIDKLSEILHERSAESR